MTINLDFWVFVWNNKIVRNNTMMDLNFSYITFRGGHLICGFTETDRKFIQITNSGKFISYCTLDFFLFYNLFNFIRLQLFTLFIA